MRAPRRWLRVGLPALALLAACQSAPAEPTAVPVPLTGEAAEGKEVFLNRGCVVCHRVPGVPEAQGTIGPNLRGVGNPATHPKIAAVVDNTTDNMVRWLMNPQTVKPGTAMPSVGLSEAEARKLAAFMETLK
jgi:cytochrome c2